jgi:hypothetical protein
MRPEFYIGLGMVIAFVVNAIVRRGAPQRHARYKMRAKLAQWLYEGRLKPVSLRRVARRGTPKRAKVLSVVRRRDPGAGSAAS